MAPQGEAPRSAQVTCIDPRLIQYDPLAETGGWVQGTNIISATYGMQYQHGELDHLMLEAPNTPNEPSGFRPGLHDFVLHHQRDRASSSGAAFAPSIVVHPAQAFAETGSPSQPHRARGRHHYRRRTTGLLTRSQPEGLPIMPNPSTVPDVSLYALFQHGSWPIRIILAIDLLTTTLPHRKFFPSE